MSELHQALQDRIAAHTPALPPSFDALKARKRSRDRRRALAAVAASSLAVAGVALAAVALTGSGGGRGTAQVAQDNGADRVFGFHVKATDAAAAAEQGVTGPESLQRCLNLPGLSDAAALYSYPAQYTGLITGRANADALRSCVQAVPGWGVTLTPAADPVDPPTGGPSPSAVERAAIRPPTEVRMQALLTGTLRADPATGCLWVEAGRGLPPVEVLLQGGDGYRVDFSTTPATIRDGETILATVGEMVELGGGSTGRDGDGVPGCPASGSTFLGYFEGRPWS